MRQLAALSSVLLLVFAFSGGVASASHPAKQTAVQKAKHELFQLIVAERKSRGLPAYVLSKKQSRCSRNHSRGMAKLNLLSHNAPPAFPKDICIYAAHAAGENIGMEPIAAYAAVKKINAAMMAEGPCPTPCAPNSSLWELHHHFYNLVSRAYHTIGIGIVYQKGKTWVTEDFVG